MRKHPILKAILLTGVMLALQSIALRAFAVPNLNGLSVHSELGKEQFIAALSVTTLSSSSRDILIASEEKQMQVRIVADRVSARSFKRMWIEGMAINASSSELTENAQTMADFSNLMKIKMVKGDIFTISREAESTKIILNGVTLGELNNPKFFDLLLRTWIGPVPLSSDFRDGLLVAGNIDSGLLARFDATFPSDTRVAAVQSVIEAIPTPEPKVAAAPAKADVKPKVEVAAPIVAAPPAIAQLPRVKAPNNTATQAVTPAEPQVVAATPKPTPKPVKAAPSQQALLDSDLLEEEEDDDLDFTAESLLTQQLYIASLKKWSHKYLRYPRRALDRSWQGNVRLSITLNRDGKVQDVVVIEESKHDTLTKAAVKAAEKASPFPAIPKEIAGDSFSFTLPVVFKLSSE